MRKHGDAEGALPRLSSADGFVRLSLDDMLCLRFEHLLSGLERDDARATVCGASTTIRGYSEWISCCSPRLSLGWDWQLISEQGLVALVRVGLPHSNVMLVDRHGVDYGWERNHWALATVVDALPWRDDTQQALARCTL